MSTRSNITLVTVQEIAQALAADYGITLNLTTWIRFFSPTYPLFILGYLSQKPDSYTHRILVLHVLVFTVYLSMNSSIFVGVEDKHLTYKLSSNMYGVYALLKGIDITFHSEDFRKVPEKPKSPQDNVLKSLFYMLMDFYRRAEPLIFSIRETIEVLSNARGIGLKFGNEVPIPIETRPLEKIPFLKSTLRRVIRAYIIADLLSTFWSVTTSYRIRAGGSIYLSNLSWPIMHIVAIFYNFSTCIMVIAFGELAYYSATIQAVLLLSDSPEAWPPVFGSPCSSNSLHEFWGRHWHQLLYRLLKVYGATPGGYLAQRIGLPKKLGQLFGTFLLSGLIHELPFVAAGYDLGWKITAFFVMQAVFMVMERIWRDVTGKRVGGRAGRIWTACTLTLVGTPLFTDAYVKRGVWSTVIFPRAFSFTRQIIIPIWNLLANKSTILPYLSDA